MALRKLRRSSLLWMLGAGRGTSCLLGPLCSDVLRDERRAQHKTAFFRRQHCRQQGLAGMYTFPSFLTAQVARSDVVRSLGPARKKLRGNSWGARYEARRSDYCDVCQRTFSDSLAGDPIHCTRRRGGDGSGRRCRFCLQEMLVRRGTRSGAALEGCSEDGRSWKAVILEGSEQRRQEWLRST